MLIAYAIVEQYRLTVITGGINMKLANSIYVLCEDQKDVDELKEICEIYGAYFVFTHNAPNGGMLYEVIAFSDRDLRFIKKEIEA